MASPPTPLTWPSTSMTYAPGSKACASATRPPFRSAANRIVRDSPTRTVSSVGASKRVRANGEGTVYENKARGRYEGMLVRYDQTLTATEVFNLGRFGEVSLSGVGRLWNPTAVALPGAPALDVLAQNNRSRIILDDGNNQQNIDPTRYPQGGLTASNTLRVGDTLDGLTGVMDFRFSNYRIQPVGPIEFDVGNPRTTAPEPVGGNLKVASFNVLNYFNGDGLGGGFPTSRGALSQFELERQSAKIVSALAAIDADVVGLMEIENAQFAVEDLVDGLNGVVGTGTDTFGTVTGEAAGSRPAARPCRANRVMPSSRKRCARATPSTAGRRAPLITFPPFSTTTAG